MVYRRRCPILSSALDRSVLIRIFLARSLFLACVGFSWGTIEAASLSGEYADIVAEVVTDEIINKARAIIESDARSQLGKRGQAELSTLLTREEVENYLSLPAYETLEYYTDFLHSLREDRQERVSRELFRHVLQLSVNQIENKASLDNMRRIPSFESSVEEALANSLDDKEKAELRDFPLKQRITAESRTIAPLLKVFPKLKNSDNAPIIVDVLAEKRGNAFHAYLHKSRPATLEQLLRKANAEAIEEVTGLVTDEELREMKRLLRLLEGPPQLCKP